MKKILLVISLCFILTGCGNYAELDKLAIVTGVAIDKDGDDYEISYLVANSPKGQTSSKEGEAKNHRLFGNWRNDSRCRHDYRTKKS